MADPRASIRPEHERAAFDYGVAARAAGCPVDQLTNFLKAGIYLQPRQLAASAAARLCDRTCGQCQADGDAGREPRFDCPDCGPTEIGYGGARGGGKSHWSLAQVCADDCQRYPGLKFLYLRKVGKAGREAIQDLRRDVLHSVKHEYKIQEGVLVFPNGSRVVLGHFQHDRDIDNYLGLQYDGALIEESTQLTSRKVQDVRTCVRTSKPGWRPRIYHTANPGGIGHAHFKAKFVTPFRAGREGPTRFIPATVRDNRHVNHEYRRSLELLTGWVRKAWLDGDWDIAAGQYFTTWRRDLHVIPAGSVPENWRVWMGLDYGFTHYTSAYLLAKDGDGNLFCVHEHCERGWIIPRHVQAIRRMLNRNGVAEYRLSGIYAGADVFAKKQSGGTIADDYAELGMKLTAANDDRINGAAEILARLGDADADPVIRPTLFISENCPRLIECLPALEHDPHRPEDVLKVDTDDDGLGGDDPYDGFRYACMAAAKPRRGKTKAGGERPLIDSFKVT